MIYGVGINDSKYPTQKCETKVVNGKRIRKVVWKCPYYSRWTAMLTRCYNKNELAKHPTYRDKFVCDEWLTFSNFKSWMETQDWKDKHLDKDILVEGNTVYSKDRCVFIDQSLNKFLLEKRENGRFSFGVSYHKTKKKFIAASAGKQIGAYDTEAEASIAWCEDKLRQAIAISKTVEEKVGKALVLRYTKRLQDIKEK